MVGVTLQDFRGGGGTCQVSDLHNFMAPRSSSGGFSRQWSDVPSRQMLFLDGGGGIALFWYWPLFGVASFFFEVARPGGARI